MQKSKHSLTRTSKAQGRQFQRKDIEGVIRCLRASVELYEQHPRYVCEPDSRVVTCWYASARRATYGRRFEAKMTICEFLENRAEALRLSPLH